MRGDPMGDISKVLQKLQESGNKKPTAGELYQDYAKQIRSCSSLDELTALDKKFGSDQILSGDDKTHLQMIAYEVIMDKFVKKK